MEGFSKKDILEPREASWCGGDAGLQSLTPVGSNLGSPLTVVWLCWLPVHPFPVVEKWIK